KDVLNLGQICNMINEILPADQRIPYAAGEAIHFPYAYGSGEMEVDVHQEDGNVRVSIGLRDLHTTPAAAPPPPPAARPAHAGPEKAITHIDELFRYLHSVEGSDLHLSSNEKPYIRVHGIMKRLDDYEVSQADHLKKILWDIVPQRNKDEWE